MLNTSTFDHVKIMCMCGAATRATRWISNNSGLMNINHAHKLQVLILISEILIAKKFQTGSGGSEVLEPSKTLHHKSTFNVMY